MLLQQYCCCTSRDVASDMGTLSQSHEYPNFGRVPEFTRQRDASSARTDGRVGRSEGSCFLEPPLFPLLLLLVPLMLLALPLLIYSSSCVPVTSSSLFFTRARSDMQILVLLYKCTSYVNKSDKSALLLPRLEIVFERALVRTR